MNKIVFEYIDNSTNLKLNDSCRFEREVSEFVKCPTLVKAFKDFLHALGYQQETIEKYINIEKVYDNLFND